METYLESFIHYCKNESHGHFYNFLKSSIKYKKRAEEEEKKGSGLINN